ncbi:MAG TPA: BamA/TamA family outer membrane protein [Vicinamibacterales bacterium]
MTRLALVLLLFVPGVAFGRGPQAPTNVNTRYEVESVSVSGVSDSTISRSLRRDMQKLVGNKYDPDAADHFAHRLRSELQGYTVTVKVKRGERPDCVKVVYDAERTRRPSFDARVSPLLYTTHDGFSGAIVPGFETHHNYFSFGLVSSADELLERNNGVLLRYEHRRVGTDKVQVGFEYDYFHPSFESETEAALVTAPWVPGTYRRREVFSPSVSVLPIRDIKVTFGGSFQTLEMQYPTPHDQAANAFTFGVQFRRDVRPRRGLRHSIGAEYSVRDATSTLESDFSYTRHLVAADYTLRVRRQSFGLHFQGGHLSGRAPLFERFSIGNATTLRGWDKFDVAPLGGSRLAYGSLEYRYRPFQVFYDFGSVWEPSQGVDVKHSVGVGLAWKNGFFMSLGIPLRFHGVTPAFMFGFRR